MVLALVEIKLCTSGIKQYNYSSALSALYGHLLTALPLSGNGCMLPRIILHNSLRGFSKSHTWSDYSLLDVGSGSQPICWVQHQHLTPTPSPLCHAFVALWYARRWDPCPLFHRAGWNLKDTNLLHTDPFAGYILAELHFYYSSILKLCRWTSACLYYLGNSMAGEMQESRAPETILFTQFSVIVQSQPQKG